MHFADEERSQWRWENRLEFGKEIHLTKQFIEKNPAKVPPPRRAGAANWLGTYVVKKFDFNEAALGRQELKVIGANIWIQGTGSSLNLATG